MKKLLLLAALLLIPIQAHAITFTLSGAELTLTYDEPTTNEDGSALQDLAMTRIVVDILDLNGQIHPLAPPPQVIDVPATALGGGGHISQIISVAIGANQAIKEADVRATVTALDIAGNVSLPATIIQRIDKLAPSRVN